MSGIYLYNFGDKEDLEREFGNYGDLDLSYADILLASYTYEDYSGSAFVLFKDTRDGKLYEVNGSHCSCYGLEGQWEPEETDIASLRHRLKEGDLGRGYANIFDKELEEVLDSLVSEWKPLSI